MTAQRRRIRTGLIALAAALSLGLTGCVTAFFPPGPDLASTAAPVPPAESQDPDLQALYSQTIYWEECGDGMLCGSVTVPADWAEPSGEPATIALVRKPATRDKIGSLLINPGGPGASGVDFVRDSLSAAVDTPLRERYDIIGFDPRGVGASTPVECFPDQSDKDEFLYAITPGERGSAEWLAANRAAAAEYGEACATNSDIDLTEVNTVSSARDMDIIRAALGDTTLNYLGYSYGTFLGATYAQLYPERAGRLVLDGAIDPSTSEAEVVRTQTLGFESAYNAYVEDCIAGSGCPFRSVEQGRTQLAELLASVDRSPLGGGDGRALGADTLLTAIIYPLYSPDAWPQLSQMLASVFSGDARMALQFADLYNGRTPSPAPGDSLYADNSSDAFMAYNCRDYPAAPSDDATLQAEAAKLAAAAPLFGPYMGYGGLGCADWPVTERADRIEIHAPGADPILVLGTTNDPATPYVWSEALAHQLESGVLVRYEGEGHTAYNKGNRCVNEAVHRFFLDSEVPSDGLVCGG